MIPRRLSQLAPYDVAGNICQAQRTLKPRLLSKLAPYDVAGKIRSALEAGHVDRRRRRGAAGIERTGADAGGVLLPRHAGRYRGGVQSISDCHVIQGTRHVIQMTRHVIPRTRHVIQRTRHVIPRTRHVIQRARHVILRTRHVSHMTRHMPRRALFVNLHRMTQRALFAGHYTEAIAAEEHVRRSLLSIPGTARRFVEFTCGRAMAETARKCPFPHFEFLLLEFNATIL